MYIGDIEEDEYLRQRNLRKKKWKRKRRLKRFLALIIFCLLLCFIGIAIYFLVKGIGTSISNKNISNRSDYVEDKASIRLSVVNNVYTDEELRLMNKGTEENTESSEEDISSQHSQENTDTDNPYSERKSGLIVIDAGHGGEDGGTQNNLSNEKDINLEVAYWLKEELETRGYSVYMTRTDDTYVGLQKRANLANEQDGALAMVSIHQNAVENADYVAGVEAWTYERSGCIELAECLVNNVSKAVNAENRGAFYRTNLVVTSKTILPSVIIECGYMSNPDEAAKLIAEDYQVKLARGIADALDEFIDLYY